MTPTDEKEEFAQIFVERLQKLDPGERARFKRNAGIAMDKAHDVLGLFYKRLLYDRNFNGRLEDIYFLVATLYPFEKRLKKKPKTSEPELSKHPKNFGASLGRIRSSIKGVEGLDTRFERLLDADEQQLPFYLRREVQYLVNNGGQIDWEQLLKDMLNWNRPERWVQRTWAREYFSAPVQE